LAGYATCQNTKIKDKSDCHPDIDKPIFISHF